MRNTSAALLALSSAWLGAAPAAAQEPAPAAPPVEQAGPADDPMHTFKIAIGLGAGYGYVSMERMNALVDDTEQALIRSNPGITVDGADAVHGATFAGLAVRGYFPYFIAAEVGCNAMYAFDKATARLGGVAIEVEHNELGFEVPILIGGYYPFLGQLFLTGLVGPAVFAGPMSLWDQSGTADLNDYDTDTTVGFTAVVGLDYLPVDFFAVGLDLRYRYLVSDTLKYDTDNSLTDGVIAESGHLRGDGTHDTYDIEFSGFAFQGWIKFVI